MNWILLLAGFSLGVLLVTLIYYGIYNPRAVTEEGEAFDLKLTLALVAMIALTALAVGAMYLLGRTTGPLPS